MPEAQNCGNCGITLSQEASFCVSCGASVRSVNDMKCATCGNDNPAGAQFCGGCGTSLSPGEVTIGPELPMVGFGEAISRGFSNYFTFAGRARRSEYWFWVLFTSLVQVIPLIGGLIGLAVLIPSLAVTSRRLHDIGKSGWYQLLFFAASAVAWTGFVLFLILGFGALEEENRLPAKFLFSLSTVAAVVAIAVIVILVIWFVRKGDEGPNKYGPNPR